MPYRPVSAAWLFTAIFLQSNFAPDKSPQQETAQVRDLIERVKRGDEPQALLEAGRSGNLIFVPYLRERLSHDVNKHESLRWEAQMALAKLNQQDQLQAIYCQVATGNETQVANTMSGFEYIGGWFSVKILSGVLSGELAASPVLDQHLAPDVQPVPPKLSATTILDKLIPDSGYHRTPENLYSFWTDYIRAHESELKQLQPTGEGVNFSSNACKNGKPVKKH